MMARIVKLTVLILMIPLLGVSQEVRTFADLVAKLQEETDYNFSYPQSIINHKISLDDSLDITDPGMLSNTLRTAGIELTARKKVLIFKEMKMPQSPSHNQPVRITGYVRDASSGENLIGAHIIDLNNGQGVLTNTYGFYSLSTKNGSQKISYSFIGYESIEKELFSDNDTAINISLKTKPELLEEVAVIAKTPISEKHQMSGITLNREEIKAVPAFMGEVDILKTIQLLPGIQPGAEGTSGLYVRGGGPGQNLVLLDGVPVYNANHLFGFFSVFNADAIQNVNVIKGGFPARYGGRLSSVIDIQMKEGNMNEFHGEGAVGNVTSKITVEGPINKGKTSYMLSARRTFLDLFTVPIARLSDSERITSYYFGDINAKVNHIFSDKDRIFISAYAGKDQFKEETNSISAIGDITEDLFEKTDLGWGNITTALRWNHVYNPRLFSNLTATYSRYELNFSTEVDVKFHQDDIIDQVSRRNIYQSNTRDWALKIDFDYLPTNNHLIRFGASAIDHRFNPGSSQFQSHLETDTTFGSSSISTQEFFVYVEDEMEISDRLSLNAGLHLSASMAENTRYHSLQPRVSTNLQLNHKLSVKTSYARMAQYIHLLVNSGIGLTTDLWVPVTDRIKPQVSDQVALGIASEMGNTFELTVEGYYKWMSNLIEYKDGAGFLDIDDAWEDKVEPGEGYSYGVELLLKKPLGKATGWLGYTWSKNRRDFENLNFGREFFHRYDRRHDISLALNHRLKPHIDLGIVWVYGTGFPVTLPTSTYQKTSDHITGNTETTFIKDFPGRNSTRMKDYHRLDVSISFSKKKKWGERKWVFGLYNAYSRLNPTFVEFDEDKNQFTQLSLFPVIPSFSYQFKF